MSAKFILPIVAALTLSSAALAQRPAILDSSAVKKARGCLDNLKANAQKANLYVDRDAGIILVQHSTSREALQPLLISMSNCLDDAFDKTTEIVKNPRTGMPSRIWHVKVDQYYSWCATNSLANELKDIDVLGGRSERRNWPGITFDCSVGEAILGFHKP
jgi:hypothetical protein